MMIGTYSLLFFIVVTVYLYAICTTFRFSRFELHYGVRIAFWSNQKLRTSSWFDIHVRYSHIRILSRKCKKITVTSLETDDTRRIYRTASHRVAYCHIHTVYVKYDTRRYFAKFNWNLASSRRYMHSSASIFSLTTCSSSIFHWQKWSNIASRKTQCCQLQRHNNEQAHRSQHKRKEMNISVVNLHKKTIHTTN